MRHAGRTLDPYAMNILFITLLALPLLIFGGCGEKSPGNAAKTEKQVKIPDEFTSEKQIPSVLENELSPDEKAALLNQIMPSTANEPTPEEKFLKLRKDAESGDAKAQNGLGVMYYTGEAISKDTSGKTLNNDPEKAAAWFHRSAAQGYAAEQGNVDAQNNLGVMYYSGEGVPRDTAKAAEWFKKAAAQGNADAQANLDAMK